MIITYLFKLITARRRVKRKPSYYNKLRLNYIDDRLEKEVIKFKKLKTEIYTLWDELDFLQYLIKNMDDLNYILNCIDKKQQEMLIRIIKLKEKVLQSNFN